MIRKLMLAAIAAGCISAQSQPLAQTKAYLGLTDAQVSQIVLNLNDYGRYVAAKQQRMFQVQSEIQQETAKSPLDPAALGIRYAEIEANCRNIKDEAIAVQNRNLAILTDDQKIKLKTLQDAYKLLPVLVDASNAGVLTPPGPYSGSGVLSPPIAIGILGSPVVYGCQQPGVPTLASRSGDFTAAP
jgi:hypothetical protein